MTHGRPQAFQGERFSNIFVHFAPLEDWEITGADVEKAARDGERKKRIEQFKAAAA